MIDFDETLKDMLHIDLVENYGYSDSRAEEIVDYESESMIEYVWEHYGHALADIVKAYEDE